MTQPTLIQAAYDKALKLYIVRGHGNTRTRSEALTEAMTEKLKEELR